MVYTKRRRLDNFDTEPYGREKNMIGRYKQDKQEDIL